MYRLSPIRKRSREEKGPKPDKYIDVVSLLSSHDDGRGLIRNNGDKVVLHRNTFKGKHVLLICCFHVPATVSYIPNFRCLVTLCNELCSTRKEQNDFEMVVVAGSEYDDKEASDRLLSCFPDSCLTIPPGNWKRHDYICKELGFDARDRRDSFQCIFVNAEGMVSLFPRFDDYDDILTDYGAEAFPFTEDVLEEKDEECKRLVFEESNNLEAVLRCDDSSPAYVYRFGSGGGPGDRLHISELSNKHVGLLLCSSGDLIYKLVERYEQCRKNKLDFEVVVVYSPVLVDEWWPERFKSVVDSLLQSRIGTCRSWWCLPFNDSVTKRFRRMTRHHNPRMFCDFAGQFYPRAGGDKLIVVGPGVRHLDMYGGEVMKCEGIDGYPFTTEAAIINKMKKLQKFTLESLFAGTGVTRGDDRQRRVVPVGEVKASKIFLFFVEVGRFFDFEATLAVYTEMKERFGYEVVLVEVGANLVPAEEREEVGPGVVTYTCPITGEKVRSQLLSDEERRDIGSKMPWYVCPLNKSMAELLRAIGKSAACCGAIVGFGSGGRVYYLSHLSGKISLEAFKPRRTTLYHDVEKFLGYNHLVNRSMQCQ